MNEKRFTPEEMLSILRNRWKSAGWTTDEKFVHAMTEYASQQTIVLRKCVQEKEKLMGLLEEIIKQKRFEEEFAFQPRNKQIDEALEEYWQEYCLEREIK